MLKSITQGQYFTADASMGNEQYNDGYATGMQDLVELQPAMLEAVIRGYFGVDLRLMEDLVTISPNLPTEWVATGDAISIATPDLNYSFTQSAGKLTVELRTPVARKIEMRLPVRAAVHGVTVESSAPGGTSATYRVEAGHVSNARVIVKTPSAATHMKAEIQLGPDASVTGDRTVVIGEAATFKIANAKAVAIHDPQGVVERSHVAQDQIALTPTVEGWQLQDGLEGWPLPATVFVEMVAEAPTNTAGKKAVTWLAPLDLKLVPPWRLETIAVAAKGEFPPGHGGVAGCPDGTAPPCVALPRLGDISPPPAPAPPPPLPPSAPGALQMVDCASPKALNFSSPAVAKGDKGVIRVVGTDWCLSDVASSTRPERSIVLQSCAAAPHWYWRSGYHAKEGGHLCLAADVGTCLDRAHHSPDSTTIDTFTFVPTVTEKFHDENWALNGDKPGPGHLISRCVEPSCAAHQCVGGEIPAMCCWNRIIQGCNATSECDSGGEGCVPSGTQTKRYGVVTCHTCASQGEVYDPATASCKAHDDYEDDEGRAPTVSASSNVSVTLMLRNDGGAPVTGLANVSLPALQFSATAAVNLPAGGQQQLVVNISQEAQLARISPGTTRVAVTLAGRTQVADAVRWSPPPGRNFSARIRPLDLSNAFNFDAEELYSVQSIAARWRIDCESSSSLSGFWIQSLTESDCTDTGVGIGIEAQLRYNK